jgi:membrane-bound serine protease (ClpP class)
MATILFLFVIGLLLIVLELFITPGLVVGIAGIVAWIIAIVQIYVEFGAMAGNISSLLLIVLMLVATIWGMKSKIWKKVTVETNIVGKSSDMVTLKAEIGMRGKCLSALRPTGSIFIDGNVLEAVSRGEFITEGSTVEVIRVEQGKITVKQINN